MGRIEVVMKEPPFEPDTAQYYAHPLESTIAFYVRRERLLPTHSGQWNASLPMAAMGSTLGRIMRSVVFEIPHI